MQTIRTTFSAVRRVRCIGWLVACVMGLLACRNVSLGAAATNAVPATNSVSGTNVTSATNSVAATEVATEEPVEYRNWVQLGLGGVFVSDDKTSFQRRHSMPRGAFGGLEDFHYEEDAGK